MKIDNKTSSLLESLKDKAGEQSRKKQYDSAIIITHEFLKISLKENKRELIANAYDKLSIYHGILREYDSAIFYAHKLLKVASDDGENELLQKSYGKLARYHVRLKKYDSAFFYGKKQQGLVVLSKDKNAIADVDFKLGLYHLEAMRFTEAYRYFDNSKNLYLEIDDINKAIKSIVNTAQLLKTIGSYGESQLTSMEGLRYSETYFNVKYVTKLNYLLAIASKENQEFNVALRKINVALSYVTDSISRKAIGEKNIIKYRTTKANILLEQQNYDDAITMYYEILSDATEMKDTLEIARINNNLGKAILYAEGFNEKAEYFLNKVRLLNEEIENTSLSFSNTMNFARLYKNKDIKKSLAYLDEALCIAETINNLNSIHEVLKMKMHYDNAITNEEKKYYLAIDGILDKNRQDISSVHAVSIYDHNNYVKEVAQKEKQNLGLLFILFILLVITFFIYQKIKRRHKIEKVKTVHATEVRIATKVHDELANDIHNLMARLETSDPDKDNVLDKLDVIYNNARDISKQNSSVETGKGFSEELSNLFRSYQSEEVNVLLKKYDIDIWKGISSHVKITIYRVLQELLTNTKKHSNAALVVVSIEKISKQLCIQYTDNGKGFDEEISKNGLLNAENRIHAIKGKLTFDTELHNGCKFNINVPV